MLRNVTAKIILTICIGIISALFVFLIKFCTEFTENIFVRWLFQIEHHYLLLIFPVLGLLLVWVTTTVILKAPLRGIGEVLDAIQYPSFKLKSKRIAAHFFGGFFTVAMGGSTGIEVSSVISSAAIGSTGGSLFSQGEPFIRYLLIAGGAAGIATLFNSPLGGLFFAFEVLSESLSVELFGLVLLAIASSTLVSAYIGFSEFIPTQNHPWRLHALPFFIGLALLVPVLSVYLTRSVLFIKYFFLKKIQGVPGVIIGGAIIGVGVFVFHPLYGEGYSTVQNLLTDSNKSVMDGIFSFHNLMFFLALLIVKPIMTAVTLAAGGDGGVFAPSLFIGAVLGFIFSATFNQLAGTDLIVVNFVIVGMAALLGATIHAPFTAIFLVISLINSYDLIVPMSLACFLSFYLSKRILPYTVYSYGRIGPVLN